MSNIAKSAEFRFLLDGQSFVSTAPEDWEELTVEADYQGDSIQPNISIDNLKFTGDARAAINDWIRKGTLGGVGIFEGMPFQLTLFNNTPIQESFKGFLDFTNGYKDFVDDGFLEVGYIDNDGVDNFFEQIEGTTFGYLEEIGAVTTNDYIDIPYVVEKKFNLLEILVTSLVLYLMVKELATSIRNTSDAISDVVAMTSIPLGGAIGAAIRAVAITLINIIYTAVLLIAVINLAQDLISTLVPPKRTHKAIMFKRALEVVCNHFGYNLVAPIDELNFLAYLPSNPNLDEKTSFGFIAATRGTQSGIPNTLDSGYNCAEMFELAKKCFYAKIAVIGNDIHVRPVNDPFWIQTANWNLPSITLESLEYNLDDMKSDRLISFETDLNDDWTIDNYGGTAYEIRTQPKVINNKRAVLLKGLDEVQILTALGNRKDSLNPLEILVKSVANFIDTVTGALGGGTNFASFTGSVGQLKQSSNWHAVPKLIYQSGGVMPTNHRSLWSAQVIYDKYHKEKSFVLDNWRNQKYVYNNVRIPFGFEDYKILLKNPYFYFKGRVAKITKFVWKPAEDEATISFWVRTPYSFNLEEIYINPQ